MIRVLLRREMQYLQEHWNAYFFVCILFALLRNISAFLPMLNVYGYDQFFGVAGAYVFPVITYVFASRSFIKDRSSKVAEELILAPGTHFPLLAAKFLAIISATFIAHAIVSTLSLAFVFIAPVIGFLGPIFPLTPLRDLIVIAFFSHAGYILGGTVFLTVSALYVHTRHTSRTRRLGGFLTWFVIYIAICTACVAPTGVIRDLLFMAAARKPPLHMFLPLFGIAHALITLLALGYPIYILARSAARNLSRALQHA